MKIGKAETILKVDDLTMKAMEREGASRRSVTYKGHFQWPSKSSVLGTPERKRSRRSTSFADSGLGSSIFGSPPSKSIIMPTAPTLKTPTRKKSPNSSSPSSQSPLKSFLHVSAFSDAFCPPENCSPPSKFRLSDPGKAVEYRFSGTSVPENETPINMADDALSGAVPSTSFKDSSFRSSLDDENDDNVTDSAISYGMVETPSKGFKNEMNMAAGFIDDSFSLLTSTPLHIGSNDDISRSHAFIPSHYTIPEQANGPLESSLCEPVDQFRIHTTGFLSPVKSTDTETIVLPVTRISQVEKISPLQQRIEQFYPRLTSNSTVANPSRMCLRETNYNNRPFRPPTKALKVNSKKWLQITCGETPHQMEMTRMAKFFLDSGQCQIRGYSGLSFYLAPILKWSRSFSCLHLQFA
ncbi:putative E3 ubiquitin-protein ligase [Dirofilaria immitis]